MPRFKRVSIWFLSLIFTLSAALLSSGLLTAIRGGGGLNEWTDRAELYRTKPLTSAVQKSEEDMATLVSLQYNGTNIVAFTPNSFVGTHKTQVLGDTAVYKVELASGTSEIPTVTATAAGSGAVEIIDATDLSDGAKNFTLVKVTEEEVVHYYKIVFTVASIPADAVYRQDFNASGYDASVWKSYARNSSTPRSNLNASVQNGALRLNWTSSEDSITYDTGAAFNGYNKMFHAKVKFVSISGNPRFGLMAPGVDSTNYQLAEINNDDVMWENNASWGTLTKHGMKFQTNVVYDFAVKTLRNADGNIYMRLYIDGSKLIEWTYNSGTLNDAVEHHFGFRTWYTAQTIELDDLYVTADMPADPPAPTFSQNKEDGMPDEGTYETISSTDMKVIVGNDFPFVYQYRDADDNFLANGIEPLAAKYNKKLIVNGNTVDCVSERIAKTDGEIVYRLTVNDYDGTMFAVFTVRLAVAPGKVLRLEFTDIKEAADTIVKTFSLPNHSMISMRGDDTAAAVGQFPGWGPQTDTFVSMTDVTANGKVEVNSYTLLNDNRVAAAIENNAVDGQRKFVLAKSADTIPNYNDEYVRRMGVYTSTWGWNFYNKSMPKLTKYEVPFAEVKLGGDENQDGNTDWHDSALAYRDIMVKPYKSEQTKDYYTYIAFNMSGMAENPSVRILDRAKGLSYITDGFGQKIMNKGYQVGGHDDSHGDYDNVSLQQGGAKDFEFLSTRGADYNIKTGIHINVTEFPLDGFETELDNLNRYPSSLQPNWSWLDQAYWVNKEKDLVSGQLQRRVDELAGTLPNLDFIYVDVYQDGSKYPAKALAQYFEQHDWALATEAAGDFIGDATLYHWNTDLYYAAGGTQSEIIRFIYNDLADTSAPDRALLGMLMPGVAQWKDSNFNEGVEVFYRNNLATKYLQHFELQDWVKDTSARFDKNVRTSVTNEGGTYYFNLYRDDLLLGKIDVTNVYKFSEYASGPSPRRTGNSEIFIPWSPETEEKIYYWNDVNSESTWSVPLSWAGTSKAYLYRLTESGRTFVKEVEVTNGQVTIAADKSTPYLLSKEKTDLSGLAQKRLPNSADNWGEGSVIKNFGFTSGDLTNWSAVGNPEVVKQFTYTYPYTLSGYNTYNNKGDALVRFTDLRSTLNQTLTVEENSTYSFSVWAYTENRPVTLKVTAGDKEYYRTVADTHKLNMPLDPNKYKNTRFQRIKVDVPIPKGVTKVQLEFLAEEGAGTVLADDFRAWKWTNASGGIEDYYLVKDDYENVDEQHGMFVAFQGGEPGFHLAQRDLSEGSKQIKDFVIDGEWSLKDPYTGVGLHMRTVPSTLQLDRFMGQYKVSMDYMVFKEARHGVAESEIGYNMPTNAAYAVKLHREDGTVIATYNLKQSTFASTEYTYHSRPSVEHLEFYIDGSSLIDSGSYLALYETTADTTSGQDEKGNYYNDAMLILDNVEVIRMRRDSAKIVSCTIPEQVQLQTGEKLPSTVKAKVDSLGEVELPVRYSGFDETLLGIEQTVTAVLDTQNYYVDGSVGKSYTLRVTVGAPAVKKTLVAYEKPADRMTQISAGHGLQNRIAVSLSDGTIAYLPVSYTGFHADTAGVQIVTGTIDTAGYETAPDFSGVFTVSVQVVGGSEQPAGPSEKIKGTVLGLGLGFGIPAVLLSGGALGLALVMFLKKKKV